MEMDPRRRFFADRVLPFWVLNWPESEEKKLKAMDAKGKDRASETELRELGAGLRTRFDNEQGEMNHESTL
ncbi:hypothetical protein H6P81_011539 [Aristolochia fimbriata]|uniref:Uncharacterized protein n=1 Tax=Aristolochia fimbriata TaxID=158543 RepID=A0AAV7ESJ3_ARIFI|nr:hypothetical protein H6P81_011539 [Aristolochia fimbriata]